ncbi:MAG: cation:proton antiporter domain-containing protein, partial [Planctomycetota bacterium]
WPSGWKHVVFWAGLKGSIPLALVLGLPLEPLRPLRDFLVPVVFGVVLVSLLLQGLTIPALIKAVDVGEDGADAPEQAE